MLPKQFGLIFILSFHTMAFNVTFLGTGAAAPSPERGLSATLVNHDEILCLFDCGEGTQMQMLRYKIKIFRIKHIFVSHLHGDHYFGLVGLLFTYHLHGRKEAIHIYGPRPLADLLVPQIKISVPQLSYPIHFHHIEHEGTKMVCEEKKFTVEAFPLLHRLPTYGFLVREKSFPRRVLRSFILNEKPHYTDIVRIKAGADYTTSDGRIFPNSSISEAVTQYSFAYLSDTAYMPAVAPLIRGVSLLYHEATFMEDLSDMAPQKGHSTAAQAAHIARLSDAGKLILGHISPRYDNPQAIAAEARAIFPDTQVAFDGMKCDLRP